MLGGTLGMHTVMATVSERLQLESVIDSCDIYLVKK